MHPGDRHQAVSSSKTTCEVAAGDEGCLGDGQNVIDRTAHARGEDARDELVVAVEEDDGAVALAAVAALLEADDEAAAL